MIERSNETVVDLVSAESYRGTFAGDVPVAGGLAANGDPRYQVGLVGTYLTKGRSLYVDLNAERLDGLIGGGGSVFQYTGSPEPIGTLPRELPLLRPARVSVGTANAPAALVGDAERRGASFNYHHRLPSGDRIVARGSHTGALDALGAATSLRARDADAGDLAYDISEGRESRSRPTTWTADLQYDGTSVDRGRTWRVVGLARQARERGSDRLELRDERSFPSGATFPVGSSGRRFVAAGGGRLNQRLSTTVAIQAFVDGGASAIREDARLRIAGRFPLDGARTLMANDSIAQTTQLDYAYLRSGVKAFARFGTALLDAKVGGAIHRYDTRSALGSIDVTPGQFNVQSTYRTAELAAGTSLAISSQWRGRVAFGAEAIRGPFAEPGVVSLTGASVAVASYDLSAERVVGKLPALTLAARRRVTLPTPAARLGVPQVDGPLSLSRELPVATAQVQELLFARWRRSNPTGKGNAAAELTYVWRKRELSDVYRLEGATREIQVGRPLNGSSVSLDSYGDRQLLNWQSILEWRALASYRRQDANVTGAAGRYTRTEAGGEFRYYWLRSTRVLPRVEVRAGYSEVGGALRARSGFVSESLSARIRLGKWYLTPMITLEHVLVEQEWARAYVNGTLELAYPIGRREGSWVGESSALAES